MDNRPIGIFDSGVGGLTVAREVMKALPNEKLIYFGDTARVPYGSKSKEVVTKYAAEISEFLIKKDVKAIVIACNTVSSNSYDMLSQAFQIPLIEVITPGVKNAVAVTKNNKIGVIGTSATINSHAYRDKIKNYNQSMDVFETPCPLFVPLVEEGLWEDEITSLTVKKYLNPMVENNIDTLILGCTHYPLLFESIKKFVGEKITIVNPAYETAKDLEEYITKNNLSADKNTDSKHEFYISDYTPKFKEIALKAIGKAYEGEIIQL